MLRAASWAAAHHERRALCSHADAEAVGRGLGSPRPRIADAAAALCGTPHSSCHKSIDARAHHRFHGELMLRVLCCRRSTTVALFKPAPECRLLVVYQWLGGHYSGWQLGPHCSVEAWCAADAWAFRWCVVKASQEARMSCLVVSIARETLPIAVPL